MQTVDNNVSTSSNYNKLNIYILNQTKSKGVDIVSYTDNPSLYIDENGATLTENELTGSIDNYEKIKYITFKMQDGTKNTFVKLNDVIYFNKAKLCDNVEDFDVIVQNNGNKKVIKVKVQFSNKTYSTEYVLSD